MRNVFSSKVETGRCNAGPAATQTGDCFGLFRFRSPVDGDWLKVIVSNGGGWQESGLPGEPWEHVSVSRPRRTPTWEEMCYIKDLFFAPDEWVVQFHPAKQDHVNVHEHCLHLWRPVGGEFPVPPVECV